MSVPPAIITWWCDSCYFPNILVRIRIYFALEACARHRSHSATRGAKWGRIWYEVRNSFIRLSCVWWDSLMLSPSLLNCSVTLSMPPNSNVPSCSPTSRAALACLQRSQWSNDFRFSLGHHWCSCVLTLLCARSHRHSCSRPKPSTSPNLVNTWPMQYSCEQ